MSKVDEAFRELQDQVDELQLKLDMKNACYELLKEENELLIKENQQLKNDINYEVDTMNDFLHDLSCD
jgi:uncharacterized protein YoxC